MYGFTGGGLPASIRTMFVEPWDNTTAYPILATDVQLELQTRLPRQLGVRLAPQASADAIVRGRLTGYNETTVNVNPNTPDGQVQALERRVEITFESEIYDVKENRVLWRGNGINAIGVYQQSETVEAGRRRAIEQLIQKVVEGAQSQW